MKLLLRPSTQISQQEQRQSDLYRNLQGEDDLNQALKNKYNFRMEEEKQRA